MSVSPPSTASRPPWPMLPEPSGSPPEDRQPIMEEATPECSEGSQQASQRVPQDDGQTVKAETKSTTPEVEREAPASYRSGRATSPDTVGKRAEIDPATSAERFLYTLPLHNRSGKTGESGGNLGRTPQARRYIKPLHVRTFGIVLRDNRYYYRRRVPALLKAPV